MEKIYTAVFRNYYSDYNWFGRDSGLVTNGLRSIRVESRLVILDSPGIPDDERFLPATRAQFSDPHFWNNLKVDAVILQGGGEVGTQKVADAIQASQAKLFLRMDTDGVIDPIVDPVLYFYGKWWNHGKASATRYLQWEKIPLAVRDAENTHSRRDISVLVKSLWKSRLQRTGLVLTRPFVATGITALKLLFPNQFGARKICSRLNKADAILCESKIATARLQRLLHHFGESHAAGKVYTLPIPIPRQPQIDSLIRRENIIITAGRLYDDQKDIKLFVKVVAEFLKIRSDYRVVIIGDGDLYVENLVKKSAPSFCDRICVIGRSSAELIHDWESRAKIFLTTSRGEGFPNAIAESLCRGCSVVGPNIVAAVSFAAGNTSGTIASSRRIIDLLDALLAEANEWDAGGRDPCQIAEHYGNTLDPAHHASELVAILEKILSNGSEEPYQ